MLDECFDKFDLVSIYLSKQNDVEGVAILEPPRSKAISVSRIPVPWFPVTEIGPICATE